jgi:integrase
VNTTEVQSDATALIAAVLANPTALAVLRTLSAAQKPESPTVRECWEHFTKKPKSPNNQRKYGYTWNAQLDPFFGSMRVDELTIEHVEAYRAKRRKDRTKTRSKFTTPGARNSELKVLKSCLSWAVLTQKIARNPLVGLKQEPSDGTRDTLLSDEMLQACLAFADLDMRAFILVCIGSGLRKMECAQLKWSDLDLEVGLVWLRADLSKTKKRRTTLLTDAALEALRELRYPKAHDVPPGLSNMEQEVYRAIREGANTWDALKKRLKVSQPTLMPVIHRLAVRKLLERTPSPHGTGTQFLSTRGFKVLPFSYPGGSPDPLSPYVFPSPRDPLRHVAMA